MVTSLLMDFGITSALLVFAYILRRKIVILQRLFLPAPLIAGILGVLLGPNVLGLFSPVYLQYSEFLAQTSLPLLSCVFCTQLFMIKFDRGSYKKSLHVFLLLGVMIFTQVIIGVVLVRLIMPGANDGYGMMPFTSFFGGPGVCAIVTNIVGERNNFSIETATSIGNAYATISMLTGVIIGMALINIARRKGVLTQTADIRQVPEAELTGFINPEDRQPSGEDVTGGNSINTMSLQFSVAGIIIFFGLILHKLMVRLPLMSTLAITVPIIVAGFFVGVIFKAFKWDTIVDRKSLGHFSSIALEYMIAQTIASTNIKIFLTHGNLIIVTTLVILATNILLVFGLGKLWNRKHWFENAVGVYGVANGVAATGLLLLRTADPNDVTGALPNFCTGLALTMITTQTFYLAIIPMWISDHGNGVFVGTAIALATFLLLGFLVKGKDSQ